MLKKATKIVATIGTTTAAYQVFKEKQKFGEYPMLHISNPQRFMLDIPLDQVGSSVKNKA